MTASELSPDALPWQEWIRAPGCWAADPAPDGRAVVHVSDRSGLPRAWVQAVGRGSGQGEGAAAPARELALPPGEHALGVAWSADGAWIACLGAPEGMATRTRVWLARPGNGPEDGPEDGEVRRVAGTWQGTAAFGPWHRRAPILPISTTGPRPEETASYLLDVDTGHSTPVAGAVGLTVVDLSHDGRLALLRHGPRGRRSLVLVDLVTGRQRALVPHDGGGRTDAGSFLPDGSVLARTDVGHEHAVLVHVGPHGHVRTVAAREDAELDVFCVCDDGLRAALVWNVRGGSEVELLDVRDGVRRAVTLGVGVTVVDRVRFTRDGTSLLVCGSGPATAPGVWVTRLSPPWRTASRPRSTRAPQRVDRPAARLPRADLVVSPSREVVTAGDGTPISGWLFEPPRRTGPVGTVIHLHGGPEAQERPGFAPLFQALVAAGLAVFAPNVRGSTGHGRAFELGDEGVRRLDAIRDVAACALYLQQTRIAAPARVACMGRSYGGYLTLAALTSYPELFAAGVSICGMSDLPTFFAETEPWVASVATVKYGDPVEDAELLGELSPLRRFRRLRAPLLLVHGAHDRNVPVGESERAHAEARRRGVPTSYLLFPDEGHEIARPANRERLAAAIIAWLAEHLGD
ncbi:MAG TPA: alpha/beta fold hydrolase [Mycobacteriales bacterium]|nr:alpha/beta fold hydrolase [Mycobacteriales bacterium]